MIKDRERIKNRNKNGNTAKNGNSNLDLDSLVTDMDTHSEDFQIDFEVGDDSQSTTSETPVDFSVSKDLVPLRTDTPAVDSTINRSLVKMNDFDFLDQAKLEMKRIVYPEMEDYALMNSFREIRTRLLQKSENKNFILMVVSLDRNMGATFTTVNIGAAFSYEGEKTSLLIDCHHQKGGLSNLMELEAKVGLSDYINNPEIELGQVIYPTGISRMRLIPFGSSHEGRLEFLTSERMREFVGVLKRKHADRFIILNAPPLELSADAAILSEMADYVLVVIPYGRISNSRLKKAIKSLPREKIAGVVMNDCKRYV